ncbi:3-deoxy-D-manno-octulosonic-acid transferase [Haloferula luteola]|uniref:3-deoxy-D-manno-octulosonic acid transferase n=2 Tax=Haloferula luteola TaxID=595692 RepID=A0A840V1T4_9BACT|nr:3-deoxy-D-manno-octulosonic-acid transferase [Haloferula luteola]
MIYRCLLPVYVLAAGPAWVLKMIRRGGWTSGLGERFGKYREDLEFEPCGQVHVHAVSVGETMLALKLIRAWQNRRPGKRFVLAVATATGRQVAEAQAPEGVRVVYQPVDFRILVERYLKRFEPSQVVLVEGEMWPHLMRSCACRNIPVRLVNARMSPRSRRRFRKLADWVRPVFRHLDAVAVQEASDAEIWQHLGVSADRVSVTGSLKFDPGRQQGRAGREEFGEMIEALAGGKPPVLAASTHAGEEVVLANAVFEAGGFPVVVPRHAERREEVLQDLAKAGGQGVLRSRFQVPVEPGKWVLVVDSTGELRDWIQAAEVVVMGKSFRSIGGQNPAEAIEAGKPVVVGPHMENFEPLVSRMVDAGGAFRVDEEGLIGVLASLLDDPGLQSRCAVAGQRVLAQHAGAVDRIIDLLEIG